MKRAIRSRWTLFRSWGCSGNFTATYFIVPFTAYLKYLPPTSNSTKNESSRYLLWCFSWWSWRLPQTCMYLGLNEALNALWIYTLFLPIWSIQFYFFAFSGVRKNHRIISIPSFMKFLIDLNNLMPYKIRVILTDFFNIHHRGWFCFCWRVFFCDSHPFLSLIIGYEKELKRYENLCKMECAEL